MNFLVERLEELGYSRGQCIDQTGADWKTLRKDGVAYTQLCVVHEIPENAYIMVYFHTFGMHKIVLEALGCVCRF